MRLLIIEDEPMIALDLQDLLKEAGFDVVGVAGTLDKALAFIATVQIDAAVVDANLGGISSSPAAIALQDRGVPFVVLSGYAQRQHATDFPKAPFIQKPCRPAQLIDALRAIRLQK